MKSFNQFYGTLAYSDNMSSPISWYEQACAHLGLKGKVRINQTGFILLVPSWHVICIRVLNLSCR